MKTWLVTLAEKGTFFVIDNRIYLTGAQAANDKYLQLGEERIELVPAGTVEEIIVFHDSIQKAEIYEQQKAFIQEKTKLTLETADVRKQDMLQRKTLQFIIKELMPHMSGHKEDLTEMLGEAARKQTMPTTVNAQELDEAIRQTKERLYKEQTDYARRHDIDDNEANYLRKQLSGGILVHRKSAYTLTQSKREGIIICTHKPQRYLLEQTAIDNIENQYVKYRQWRIKTQAIEALTEHIAEKQKIALATLKDFEKILQLKEFNEGDVGFLQEKEGIYVYQIIPPFAMLDPRPDKQDVCYEFPRLRTGMTIRYYDGQIDMGSPVLFEPVWHPFIATDGQPFQRLCGGNIPSKENGQPDTHWVAKALDDAKNLVMSGLTPKSIRGHGGDATYGGLYFGTPLDTKLKPRMITITQAREKGLLLTNKWKWEHDREY